MSDEQHAQDGHDHPADHAAAGDQQVGDQPGDHTDDQPGDQPGDGLESATALDDVPADGGVAEAADADDPLAATQRALEERTGDLQRLQAEFLNYKRRVERDRELLKENARYDVLAPITEVLDTVDRARESADKQGVELDSGLRAVAEQLERTVERLGLTKFGAPGDAFDPQLHEALSHLGEDAEVQVTTCKVVAKAGYRIGERVVRAAQVLVVDPPA